MVHLTAWPLPFCDVRVESRERREASQEIVRRAAVVATDTAAQQETLAALRSHGWSVVGVDAVVEDPFTDVVELTTGVDLSAIDVVLSVGGVRRLVTGPVEIRSHRPMEAHLDERPIAVPAEAAVHVTAKLPVSGHLAVRVDGRLSNRAQHLHISSPDAPARLVASPRPQSSRELDVRLHDSHLHELLLS